MTRRLEPEQRETPILRRTMLALGHLRHPLDPKRRACVVMRQHVGTYRHLHMPDALISIGVKGMADLGLLLANGRAMQIEMKSRNGELEPEQEAWRDICLELNVLWVLALAPEDATSAVLAALS